MKAAKGAGQVRIIGGAQRGRRITVADRPGLRPTPDRTRETLFNWLGPLHDHRVLDLYAGTGALGLEACSRGASEVVLIEKDRQTADQLNRLIQTWQLPQVVVQTTDALAWLANTATAASRFDLVFLDPPFDSDLLQRSIQMLAEQPLLNPGARVYLEFTATGHPPATPQNWQLHRQGQSAHTGYALYCT